jgi:hypothetical protein
LELRRSLLGETHPDFAVTLWSLAALHVNQARFAEAEPLYLQALSIFYDRLGEAHPYTQGTWQGWINFLVQVLESDQTSELSDHPMTRSILQQLQNPSDE